VVQHLGSAAGRACSDGYQERCCRQGVKRLEAVSQSPLSPKLAALIGAAVFPYGGPLFVNLIR
jgi:hypothetical protein